MVGWLRGVYGVLKVLEERGQVRRGYFVAGLGAAQFALPGRRRSAAQRPRDARPDDPPGVGAGAVRARGHRSGAAVRRRARLARVARPAGAHRHSAVVLRAGPPLVWFDRRSPPPGHVPRDGRDPSWADALVELVKDGRARSVEVRKVNGEAVGEEIAGLLRAAGFIDSYRGLVARG